MDARSTALSALIACRKQGAWADGILKEYIARDKLDSRDAALASRLCYGILQNRMLLDFYLGQLVNGPIKKLHPAVLDILRLGLYQILFLDKIPDSAAVNEAVEQTKRYVNRGAAGLVNGVLRRAVRERDTFSLPEDLSIRYSHPQALVDLLQDSLGEDKIPALLESHNRAPGIVIQGNTLVMTDEEICKEMEVSSISFQPHPWQRHAWQIGNTGNLEKLPLFRKGGFYIQDPAARLSVDVIGLQPGMCVLDACAAPGGKSFAAAIAMENQGRLISCDIHPHKIDLLRKGAERLHIQILEPTLQDAREFVPEWEQTMDAVIADVPCSGLGVIRKKPDIRYKDLSAISRLPEIQAEILENLCRYVRPGGVLLYSTCTVLKRENEQRIQTFLAGHGEFQPEPFPVPQGLSGENCGMLTLLPSLHDTDGFFICKLRRTP